MDRNPGLYSRRDGQNAEGKNIAQLEWEYNELPDGCRSRVLPWTTALYAVLGKQNELQRTLGSSRIRISEVTPLQYQRFKRDLEVKKEFYSNTEDTVDALDKSIAVLPADDATQAFRDFLQRVLRGARERVATLANEMAAMEVKLMKQANSDMTELDIRQEQYSMGAAWVGGWHFATDGSIGKTSLWVKQSASARVVDLSNTVNRSSRRLLTH